MRNTNLCVLNRFLVQTGVLVGGQSCGWWGAGAVFLDIVESLRCSSGLLSFE